MSGFTFGICTQYADARKIQEVVSSIDRLYIPHYEILLVGGEKGAFPWITSTGHLRQIASNGWLPQKKNLIARMAHFENLVLCHDYYVFDFEWYQSYLTFNEGVMWDICSNPQYLIDGNRHATDWIIWSHPNFPKYHSLSYNDWTNTKYQYVSGGYFLVKRDFLRENPLNENLKPGDPEDVEWSLRVRDKALIRCNSSAIVRHNKIHRDVGNFSFPLYSHVSYL